MLSRRLVTTNGLLVSLRGAHQISHSAGFVFSIRPDARTTSAKQQKLYEPGAFKVNMVCFCDTLCAPGVHARPHLLLKSDPGAGSENGVPAGPPTLSKLAGHSDTPRSTRARPSPWPRDARGGQVVLGTARRIEDTRRRSAPGAVLDGVELGDRGGGEAGALRRTLAEAANLSPRRRYR